MRNGSNTTKKSKLSWSKSLVRKWFNIRSKAHDFHADDLAAIGRRGECILAISIDPYPWFTALIAGGGEDEWRGSSFTRREPSMVKKSKTERSSRRSQDHSRRGKIDLDAAEATVTLDYRFQEIVPLNAGNVLGTEDNGPARSWVSLVRRTLNNLPGTSGSGSFRTPSPVPDPVVEIDDDFEGLSSRQNNAPFFHRRSFQAGLSRSLRMEGDILAPQPRLERRYSVCDRAIYGRRPSDYENNYRWGGSSDDENNTGESPSTVYSPMSYGYGNTSSLEDGHRRAGHTSRIIWLGDLNYRIALSYRLVKALVEMRNWKALLEKDQLRIEQRGGRVFVGWNEGNIYFPPTYKYSNNSDKYAGDDMNQKEKKRTPAWFGHDLKEVTCCN
ncbi:hypothetical protein PR202_ga26974 [Eleusine coracana subsp. coracana]|uniref:Inositol polyphosphate-related phosphatase domain-containing protein n=1 Tax=Eleusine coracana subsp. coracana TaxID=191504 RepID=A0AAV5DFJ5_ELECO|nr:hypothetical protein PR202_ga26974 [Eleusine coracana subsp. coracana]